MAANITGKPEAEITKDERQMAKAVNFGLLYGAAQRRYASTLPTPTVLSWTSPKHVRLRRSFMRPIHR